MFRVSKGKILKLRKMVEAIDAVFRIYYMEMSTKGFSIETVDFPFDNHYARLEVDSGWFDESLPNDAPSRTIMLTYTQLARILASASPDEYLDIYLSVKNQRTSLILKFTDSNSEKVRTETVFATEIDESPISLLKYTPAYTLEVNMKADRFLRVVQRANEDGETSVHLEIKNSLAIISAGKDRPILGGSGDAIPHDVCYDLVLHLESFKPGYLKSLEPLLHSIRIKLVDTRVSTLQLPPMLESETKFDELAKYRFYYRLQVVTAPLSETVSENSFT